MFVQIIGMNYAAVITGDIVNSTQLGPAREKQLLNALKLLLKSYKSEFFRGDSFQIYIREAAASLRVALLCRTVAIQLSDIEKGIVSDVRISLGIGNVSTPVRVLASAKGEAFILSGRTFDGLTKTGKRLSISIGNSLAQAGLEVISDYIDAIYAKMTPKQADVIIELLKGKSQKEIASRLKKSGSTVNQHVASGRWSEIDKLLVQFERIISELPFDQS